MYDGITLSSTALTQPSRADPSELSELKPRGGEGYFATRQKFRAPEAPVWSLWGLGVELVIALSNETGSVEPR